MWRKFVSKEKCHKVNDFMALDPSGQEDVDDAGAFTLRPFTMAQHSWCNIMSVEYQVWVQDDTGEKLNIGIDKMAIGVR